MSGIWKASGNMKHTDKYSIIDELFNNDGIAGPHTKDLEEVTNSHNVEFFYKEINNADRIFAEIEKLGGAHTYTSNMDVDGGK